MDTPPKSAQPAGLSGSLLVRLAVLGVVVGVPAALAAAGLLAAVH